MKKKLILLLAASLLASCTDNMRARKFGGEVLYALPPGHKLVNVTWKDDDLWFVTRILRPEDTVETYAFCEKSSWGLLEGAITIVEAR